MPSCCLRCPAPSTLSPCHPTPYPAPPLPPCLPPLLASPKAVGNMMYDKRVVRGGAAQHASAEAAPASAAAASTRHRRAGDSQRSSEVAPVAGRAHSEIQTETYLEVLADRAPEEECGVQTEAALDRPPAPLFVPAPVSQGRASAQCSAAQVPVPLALTPPPHAPHPHPHSHLPPPPSYSLAWTP